MLELTRTHTHLKVDGECQVIDTSNGPARSLVCVVGSPTGTPTAARPSAAEPGMSSELADSIALAADSVRQWLWAGLCFGLRSIGQLVLTAIGCVGAVVVAVWLMLLWPIIAEVCRLLGTGVCYASGFSGRALSNCLLRAGHSLHARSHVLHASAVLYARLRQPRAARLPASSQPLPRSCDAVLAKVER